MRTTERYGRPVAVVVGGTTNEPDRSSVLLEVYEFRGSINYRLLDAGLAYLTYYEGLFNDLREAMTTAVLRAWYADHGLWPYAVPVTGPSALSDECPVLPKLFRRLVAYLSGQGGHGLRMAGDEPVLTKEIVMAKRGKTYKKIRKAALRSWRACVSICIPLVARV